VLLAGAFLAEDFAFAFEVVLALVDFGAVVVLVVEVD
jgi:hypothetical protein